MGVLLVLGVSASAQEVSATPTTAEDRARYLRMLKEIDLPPVVSYHQAPAPPPIADYNQPPPPIAGMPMILRQHDVEEAPRES